METLQNLLRGITRNQRTTDSSNSSAQNNVDVDADVIMGVDDLPSSATQRDDQDSLPDLQSVSNSSDSERSVTSDDEDQHDSHEVVVQTTQFEQSTPMIDPHTSAPEPTERQPSPPPRTSSRRARVEDDEDEERDRRHPSQRVSRPTTAASSASSSSFSSAPTTPGIPSQLRLPQPHPQLHRLPSFASRIFDSPLPGAGITLNPPTANNNNNNNTPNPSISQPNTNASNGSTPQQPPSRDSRPRPRMPQVFNSFAITVDVNGTPVVRHFGVEPAAQSQPNQPQPDSQAQQAGRPPQVTPGTQAPTPTLFDFVGMRDLFSLLQGPGGAGLLESLTREPEDPERARRLVDALEEVPVGLVRRLERVGDGDEVGCAICWDKLLDSESFTEMDKKGENVNAREPDSQTSHSEEDSGYSSSDSTSPGRKYPKVVSLPCAHVFHASCLIPWFSRPKQTTCPTCRFNIDPENLTWKRRRFPSNASTGNATGNADHATPVVAQNVAEGDANHPTGPRGPGTAPEDAQGPAAFIPQFTPLFTLSRTVPLFPQGNGNNRAQGQEHAAFPPTSGGAPAATQSSQSDNAINPDPDQPNTDTTNTNPSPDLPGFVTVGFDVIVGGFPPMPMGGHVPGMTRPQDGTSATGPGAPDVEMADAERPGAEGEEGRPRELDFFDHMFDDMLRRLGGFVDLTRMRQQRDAGNQDAGAPAAEEPQPQSASQTDTTTQPQSQIQRTEPSDRPALPGSPFGTQPPGDHVGMQNVLQMGTEIGRTVEEALRRFMVLPGGATRTDGAGPIENQEQASSSSSTATSIPESRAGDAPMDVEEGSNTTDRRNGQPAGTNVPGNRNEPHEDNEFGNLLANVLGGRNATAVLEGMAQGAEAQDQRQIAASGDPNREQVHVGSGPASGPPRWNGASGTSEDRQTPIPPWAATSFAGLDAHAAGAGQAQGQPQQQQPQQQQQGAAGTGTQGFPPGFLPLPTMFFPGAFHVPSRPPREKKEWELPPAPGLTLRERVEKKEREAGLRCDDMSCGVGPSDEEPFADGSAGGQMVKIRALPTPGAHLGEEGEDAVCPHVFHSSCLVSSERVALMGEDATVVGDDVEVNCSVCRSVGRIPKKIWDEGAKALA